MAGADGPPQGSWRPRGPAHGRLAGSPRDFTAFRRDDRVGVFLGCHWSGGRVVALSGASALISARRLPGGPRRCIAVHDARNLVPAAALRPADAAAACQSRLL
jgi:hypothetical protein